MYPTLLKGPQGIGLLLPASAFRRTGLLVCLRQHCAVLAGLSHLPVLTFRRTGHLACLRQHYAVLAGLLSCLRQHYAVLAGLSHLPATAFRRPGLLACLRWRSAVQDISLACDSITPSLQGSSLACDSIAPSLQDCSLACDSITPSLQGFSTYLRQHSAVLAGLSNLPASAFRRTGLPSIIAGLVSPKVGLTPIPPSYRLFWPFPKVFPRVDLVRTRIVIGLE